jgi:hypothetical protein
MLYYQHEVTDIDSFYWLTAPLGVSVSPIISSLSDNLEILRVTDTEVPQN